jgi:2-polyprenyl-3-methyl-5-hydroxy-6-metoxy-1,4-benzoquinol methylase
MDDAMNTISQQHLEEEAQAFDNRISERVQSGFIPDLRRAVKCDYFYKSFWRDPHFIALYLGRINEGYLDLLRHYCPAGATILDVGCGAGYMSLELARNGYHVTAFDISSASIHQAKEVLQTNPFTKDFGSLQYQVMPLHDAQGEYDVVLFSVSLHHMTDMPGALDKAKSLLKPGGHLLCYEPCHDRWTEADAAQVMLIRGLLALTGRWYEPEEIRQQLFDESGLKSLTADIHVEYVEERDKHESGQSPHDNEATGGEMLAALRERFLELETRPGHSFIYRLLGGIRASDLETRELADFIAAYDNFAVKQGYLNPNGFYYIGRK